MDRIVGNSQRLLVALFFICAFAGPVQAQLAQSFINVTGITTKVLPNATQIRIETDGSAAFGTDLRDFVDFEAGFVPRPTQSLRIRLVRARARLPVFVPIGAYPVDGAVVSLGREDFQNPFFTWSAYDQGEPRVQIELRFAAPILVRRFTPEPYNIIDFGSVLGPLEASVEASPDRRAIVITIVTDRADAGAVARLNRSPLASRKHVLNVQTGENGRFRLEALHTPLREVLARVGELTGQKFLAREEVAATEVSLFLPDATPAQLLEALQIGYGLGLKEEEGATVLGRSDEFFVSRSLPLQNLSPSVARRLFPDFLLPFLRADRENNALVAFQTPAVLDKISAALREIDAPRPQFEIKVEAWEIASTRERNQTIAFSRSIGRDRETFDGATGTLSLQVERGLTDRLSGSLLLLASRGRARLVASPRVTALSGERGNLFLGQTRYINILQNSGGGQTARAIPLQIGTSLGVTPRGDAESGDILLDIAPRVSTVDEIERATGLPTLGIRESNGTMRVRNGESVILAGLDFDFDSQAKGKALKIVPSKREFGETRALLVIVSARRVSGGI
ncbi:MAG TPA: hypothetical protein VGB45_12875 [Abditibacterium sp.]